MECADRTDELDCSMCTSDTYRCADGERCVPRSWVCDGKPDCTDGSDEWHSQPRDGDATRHRYCNSDQFQCRSRESL